MLQCLDAMRDRMLLGVVERKAVGRLKHALQDPSQRQRRPGRIRQALERLRKFRNRGDANLIEVEIALQQPRECFFRSVMLSIF